MKRLLWFGFYDLHFPRSRMLQAELRTRGVIVDTCRVDPRLSRNKFYELWKLSRAFRKNSYDAVVVGYPGANAVWLAKLLFRAPIAYDAGFSVWQSEVEERKTCKPRSVRSVLLFLMEWSALWLANVTFLDTRAHVDYFRKRFGVPLRKFFTLPVGADTGLFTKQEAEPHGGFIVLFYGSFIPLHGVETILDAAARLRDRADIQFRIVGDGQTASAMRRLAEERALTNVRFVGRLPQSSATEPDVLGEIRRADVVLGIFGGGRKARMQIPLKVFEALASGKAVVTADTPALRELLVPDRDLLATPPEDGAALAAALLRLQSDETLRSSIAAHGRETFEARFRPERLCDRFLSELKRLFS